MQHSQMVWVVLSMIQEQDVTANNCEMKRIVHDKKVNLCLFAAKDIPAINFINTGKFLNTTT